MEDLWAAGIVNAPGTTKHPNVEVTVIRLSAGTGDRIPVQLTTSGQGSNLDTLQLYLSVVIPIDPDQRREQIRRFLKAVESEASQKGVQGQTLTLLRENPARMAEALDAYLPQQNKVGVYEIRCAYSSRRPGFWNAELQGEPVRIQVVDQGSFLDQFVGRPGLGVPPSSSEPPPAK